jgi:hypothetical protein
VQYGDQGKAKISRETITDETTAKMLIENIQNCIRLSTLFEELLHG